MLYLQAKRSLYEQVLWKSKQLVAILVASMSMTDKETEGEFDELEQVPCILYLVTFKNQTKALLNSRSKVNVISQAFAQQLGFKICKTNVGVQKIDGTTLKTYGMVVSIFSMSDKDGRERFFEGSFLLADIKPDIMLEYPSWLWECWRWFPSSRLTMKLLYHRRHTSNHKTSWANQRERVRSSSSWPRA